MRVLLESVHIKNGPVPEGHLKVARQFIAGVPESMVPVPAGRLKPAQIIHVAFHRSSVPTGRCVLPSVTRQFIAGLLSGVPSGTQDAVRIKETPTLPNLPPSAEAGLRENRFARYSAAYGRFRLPPIGRRAGAGFCLATTKWFRHR